MQKGINTLIEETKEGMTNYINNALRQGVPVMAISLIMSNLIYEICDTSKEVITQEKATYAKKEAEEKKAKENQIEYVPEETSQDIVEKPIE